MKVVHVGTLPIEQMGVVTRTLVAQPGHRYVSLQAWEYMPQEEPDVVVLHCFKKQSEWFMNYKRRFKERVVSLVHSTFPCLPATNSDAVVFLTHYSADEVLSKGYSFKNTYVIPAALDVATTLPPAYRPEDKRFVFGRACRNADGKLHPLWNKGVEAFLEANPSACLWVWTNDPSGLLYHPRATYDLTMKIGDPTMEKLLKLSRLQVAVIAHGGFMETFSVEALELMAAGVPIVYLYQPALVEVVGEYGLCVHSMDDAWFTLKTLLGSEDFRYSMAMRSTLRARTFSQDGLVRAWEHVLQEAVR